MNKQENIKKNLNSTIELLEQIEEQIENTDRETDEQGFYLKNYFDLEIENLLLAKKLLENIIKNI